MKKHTIIKTSKIGISLLYIFSIQWILSTHFLFGVDPMQSKINNKQNKNKFFKVDKIIIWFFKNINLVLC